MVNTQALQQALDLLSMLRGYTYLREGIAKAWMAHFYNHKVKERPLKGDLVVRKREATEKGLIQENLTPN